MSDLAILVTPMTATLSVIRTFMSVPSRDFTVSIEPSTASMVPRMRTDGGCCAHATEANTARAVSDDATTRVIDEVICGMVSLPKRR